MKKFVAGISILVIGVLIGGFLTFIIMQKQADDKTVINFEYDDQLAFEGISLPQVKSQSNYALVSYVSSSCSSCFTLLQTTDKIASIWGAENLDVFYIWEDNIPKNLTYRNQIAFLLTGNTAHHPYCQLFS